MGTHVKKLLFSILVVAGAVTARPQSAVNRAGDDAPNLTFQAVGKPVRPDFYQGKILVLDFWATWCAPCIANFGHFNALATKYAANDVVFALMSEEPPSRIRRFFERTKKVVKGISLADTSGLTMNSYNITSLPSCVVIGKDNRIKWKGAGSELTADVLDKIIRHETDESQPVVVPLPKPDREPIIQRSLLSFNFALADTTTQNREFSGATAAVGNVWLNYSRVNTSLEMILEEVSGYNRATRISTNATEKLQVLYDIKFSGGRDSSLYTPYSGKVIPGKGQRNFLLTLLEGTMNMHITARREEKRHYELVVVDSAKLNSFKSMQRNHSSYSYDVFPTFEIIGYPLGEIAFYLEHSMKRVITTKIPDLTFYDLSLNIRSIEELQKGLRFHGLALKEVVGEVPELYVQFN